MIKMLRPLFLIFIFSIISYIKYNNIVFSLIVGINIGFGLDVMIDMFRGVEYKPKI